MRAILADHMHRATAARASSVLRLNDDLDPRQMLGQRPRPARRCCAGFAQCRIGPLLFGLARGNRLFEIFESQVKRIGVELFRAPAELHPLQLAKEVTQPVV